MIELVKINAPDESTLLRSGLSGYHNESTGMEYVIHVIDDALYLEAWHEDVGLVSWYYWQGTEDELIDLILEEEDN